MKNIHDISDIKPIVLETKIYIINDIKFTPEIIRVK
jgi:hypothetical protein